MPVRCLDMEHCENPLESSIPLILSRTVLLSVLGSQASHAAELAQSYCEAGIAQLHHKHYSALTDTLNALLCSTGLRNSSRCAR